MSVDLKALQNLQSKIAAATTGYNISDIDLRANDTEVYICIKGTKIPEPAGSSKANTQ